MEAKLKEILESGDFNKIKLTVSNITAFIKTHDEIMKQYGVSGHNVNNPAIRKKKEVNRDAPEGTKNMDGTPIETVTDFEEVVRVPVPFQKQIVKRAAGFLFFNPVTLKPVFIKDSEQSKQLFTEVHQLWDDNKLDFLNRKIARILFSEREVAELWYLDEQNITSTSGIGKIKNAVGIFDKQLKMKVRVLANSLGDKLYPYFDEYGDLAVF